jgi:SAM-dependent methyltransferase
MHPENKFSHNWLIKKAVNDRVRKNLPVMTGDVYDLGCGTRPYEQDIMQFARNYIGVDWSNCIHGQSCDIVADLNKNIPIDTGVADTVISFEVLEHLCEPQIMLNEAYRILKNDGIFFLSVPFMWWVHEAPWDYYRYTPHGLEYLFKKAGFVDVVVEPQSGFFTMWILKINYFSARFVRGPKPLRWLVKACLTPFWYFGQILAPLLDTLDKNWSSETCGYFVTARKP